MAEVSIHNPDDVCRRNGEPGNDGSPQPELAGTMNDTDAVELRKVVRQRARPIG